MENISYKIAEEFYSNIAWKRISQQTTNSFMDEVWELIWDDSIVNDLYLKLTNTNQEI